MSATSCPSCGARNAASAPWCTQCYASFEAPATDDAAGGAGVPADPAGAPPEPSGAPADPSVGRGVRQRDDGEVEWHCGVCGGWSPLAAPACVACGAARRGFGEPVPAPAPSAGLVARSLLLPGLGHVAAGRTGSGVARGVFALGWLLGGLVLGVAALRAGSGHGAAVALLAGAVVVWVLTALDARSLERGGAREWLDARGLLWLMVAVTVALLLALVVDASRVAG